MPNWVFTKCNKCDLLLHGISSGIMYTIDEHGERTNHPHPGEPWPFYMDEIKKPINERKAGWHSHCICLDCFSQFLLDVERDARICPTCLGAQVKTKNELEGVPCPRCESGTIESEISDIMS